jgi:hypothetical protein
MFLINARLKLVFLVIYYSCLVWHSFLAVFFRGFMVEKGFFLEGTAKTSPSEFVRVLI